MVIRLLLVGLLVVGLWGRVVGGDWERFSVRHWVVGLGGLAAGDLERLARAEARGEALFMDLRSREVLCLVGDSAAWYWCRDFGWEFPLGVCEGGEACFCLALGSGGACWVLEEPRGGNYVLWQEEQVERLAQALQYELRSSSYYFFIIMYAAGFLGFGLGLLYFRKRYGPRS